MADATPFDFIKMQRQNALQMAGTMATASNFEIKTKQVFAKITDTMGKDLGKYIVINCPMMDSFPNQAWGILVNAGIQEKQEQIIGYGFFIILNFYPGDEENPPEELETIGKEATISDEQDYVYINNGNISIKYNNDSVVLGNKDNFLAVTEKGIYMKGDLYKETSEHEAFFEQNKLGHFYPVFLDTSGTLLPYIPDDGGVLEDVMKNIGNLIALSTLIKGFKGKK